MSDATIAYARSLRNLARAASNAGQVVSVAWAPPTAVHIADMIERGGSRTRYVAEVQAEAERMRDEAEAELLRARDLNDAADRALALAGAAEQKALAFLEGLPLRALMVMVYAVAAGGFLGAALAAMRWSPW